MPEFELLTQGTSHRLIRNGQPMWPGEAVIVLNYQAGEIARLEKELADIKAQMVPDDVAKDAARYRFIRRKVCIIQRGGFMGGQIDRYADFEFLNMPKPTYMAPDAGAELDAVLDKQMIDEAYDALATD